MYPYYWFSRPAPYQLGLSRHFMVPQVGLEPTRPCGQRILSPLRLPLRHWGILIFLINCLGRGDRVECHRIYYPSRFYSLLSAFCMSFLMLPCNLLYTVFLFSCGSYCKPLLLRTHFMVGRNGFEPLRLSNRIYSPAPSTTQPTTLVSMIGVEPTLYLT